MNEIIFEDGIDYLVIDINPSFFENVKSRIIYIEFNLTKPLLGISKEDIEFLKKKKLTIFFHIAALSCFFDTLEISRQLSIINFEGTKHIFKFS